MSVIVVGSDQLERRLQSLDFMRAPAEAFLKVWRTSLAREAIQRAPRWQGTLQGGIESEQDTAAMPLWAAVFTNVKHAEPMEFGTGLLSDSPHKSGKRHWPPAKAIEPWASSKGLNAYAVAAAIGRRGGLKPRRYFRDAEKAADQQLGAWLLGFARGIEEQAGAGT